MPRPRRDGTPAQPVRKRKLTELAVRKSKPERAAYLIWDSHQRGLALRVQPTGTRAWVVVYRHHGRPRWYYLGDADAIGLADARRLASRISLQVAEGKDPAAERKAERGAGTFAELAARYVEQYAKRKNRSWRHAERLVRRYVLPRWGKLQATTISRADVKALMGRIEAPVLCNTIVNATSAIFTWAVREEILPSNPARLVERNATTSRVRVLSDSELPRFWAAFDDAGPITAAALKTLLLCGQRPGEIAHMRREHVDGGWWQMPGKPELGWLGTKNGEAHRVWLSEPVQAIIAELASDGGATGFVFEAQTIHKLAAAMRDICRALGVKDKVTPHDLRRTFCSRVTKLGFGRPAMDRLANHRQRSISDVYDQHSYEVEDRHIMEAVGNHIMSLAEGRTDGKAVPLRGR